MASTYHADIQDLYVAYFNRPADYLGLQYWEGVVEAAAAAAGTDQAKIDAAVTKTLATISAGFAASAEYKAEYAGLSTEHVIGQVYQNLFGHSPDLPGLLYWVEEIRVGHVTLADAVVKIAAGAQGTDLVAFDSKVAAAVAFTDALDTGDEVLAYSGDALEAAKVWIESITDAASLAAALVPATFAATVSGVLDAGRPDPVVTTFTMTKGLDTITGTAGNDIINASLNAGESTLTALDTINGGAGTDVLNLDDLIVGGSAFPAGLTVSNVETANVRGAGAVSVTTSTWTGLTKLSVTQSAAATITAGATTAVEVLGATGAIIVDGGSTQTVATSTSGVAVTLGATTVAADAISLTHADQAAGAIAVDGGKAVTVTASKATTGVINIGQGGAATDLASGAITVVTTGAASVAGAAVARGAINIDGGSTVSVTQTATSSAAAAADDLVGATITQSAVGIDGGAATTAVTVTQSSAVTAKAFIAAAGSVETQTVTFGAMATGETLTINGLTFTAAKALTAAQVAAAFANVASGATQGSAPAANGLYSGTSSTLAMGSGAVTTTSTASTVTFTSGSKANLAALTIAGTATGTSVTTTVDGVASVSGQAGVLGVVGGMVDIDGQITGTDVLATATLTGYGAGSTVKSDALTALNLANSKSDLAVTNAAATTLALSLNNVGTGSTLDLSAAAYTTLNITTATAASDVTLVAASVQTLSVAGTHAVDLTGATLTALKTVTVSGAAGVIVDASGATVTSVNATASSGANTVTINAANATYTGGTGADKVTLSTTTTTKAVTLGDGDDTLALAGGTTSLTAVMTGGAGTDSLSMAGADAEVASATTIFETKVEGFEKLSLGAVGAAATDTIDLANLDDINYVISAGNVGVALELDNMAAAGTLELTGSGVLVDVDLTDATGTADVLNVIIKNDGAVTAGIVDAAGVETINLTATDSKTSGGIQLQTLTLKDAALKSVVATGNANLTLTLDANVVALTSLNGSAMTGVLTATTNGTVAQTITGGSAADVLTAKGVNDVLVGGAGGDTLALSAGANLVTLTGGAGADTFNVGVATTNVNSYATITDIAAGDVIKFSAAAAGFAASKVTLGDTAVFQDYANAAINATNTGDVSWFQFGGNTYVIENSSNGTSFLNNSDIIVKLTGAVDLSTASFSSSADTLLIG